MSILSEKIRYLMSEKKLNASRLAERAQVNHSYLTKILRGQQSTDSIGYRVLEGISKALGVSIPELTGDNKYHTLKTLRESMTAEDIKLVDTILSMDQSDWRRRSALRILGMEEKEEKVVSLEKVNSE